MHSIITFFSRMFLTIYSKISFYIQEILSVLHIKIITNHSSYVYSFFNCFHIKIPILQFYMPQMLPFHNFFNFKSGGHAPTLLGTHCTIGATHLWHAIWLPFLEKEPPSLETCVRAWLNIANWPNGSWKEGQ
jgi:hypothetical protein